MPEAEQEVLVVAADLAADQEAEALVAVQVVAVVLVQEFIFLLLLYPVIRIR